MQCSGGGLKGLMCTAGAQAQAQASGGGTGFAGASASAEAQAIQQCCEPPSSFLLFMPSAETQYLSLCSAWLSKALHGPEVPLMAGAILARGCL